MKQFVEDWGPFFTLPPRAKLSPRSEFCPLGQGWSYPLGEILCSTLHSLNSIKCFPLGVNEGVNIHPREQSSPLVEKFNPRGKPLEENMLLKTGPYRCISWSYDWIIADGNTIVFAILIVLHA
jgi:hypothetical protein